MMHQELKGPKPRTMKGQLKTFISFFALVFALTLLGQDSGFIYGKITTEDGNTYEGPLRWGKEEVYWTDMFNASKRKNKNLDYLSDSEIDALHDNRRDSRYSNSFLEMINISFDDEYDFVHELSCEFGNIKSLKLKSRSRVEAELRNGEVFELSGDGYNDVGTKIKVLDEDFGEVVLSWNSIDGVEFLPTPSRLSDKFGEPLYGEVESDFGKVTGYIQWDHDERVDTDVLDGEMDGEDFSIPFRKIESIERYGSSRSIVVLKSGRELELRGTNDVNRENKGVIVTTKEMGRIDLDWKDFDRVTFFDPPSSGRDYASFQSPKKLKALVEVDNGDTHTGEVIYDLDEEYTFEVLNGKDGDTEYIIPFRYVKSIQPEISDAPNEVTTVELKSGKVLYMANSQDVSRRNQGVLVKTESQRVYVPWDRLKQITFLN